MSIWARREVSDEEAGVVDDRATRMLPLALTKSTRMLGVKLGPRAAVDQQ